MDSTFGPVFKGALLSYQGTNCDESFSFYSNLTVQPFCIPKVCEVYPNFPLRKMEDDLKSEFFEQPGISSTVFRNLSASNCISIEASTYGQSDCPKWHTYRKNRLTASTFGRVIKRRSVPTPSFLDLSPMTWQIFQPSNMGQKMNQSLLRNIDVI